MKKKIVQACASGLLFMALGRPADASSIVVGVAGTPEGPVSLKTSTPTASIIEAGWSQSGTMFNVAIEGVFCNCGDPINDVTAFLTNSIGAGTTAANVIASTTVLPNNEPWGQVPPVETTLFSGLTLGPGSYYLVVGSPFSGWYFAVDESSSGGIPITVSTAPGVVYDGSLAATNGSIDTAFLPGSTNWISWGNDPVFQVTGDATPEPGSFMLLGAALIALIGLRGRNYGRFGA